MIVETSGIGQGDAAIVPLVDVPMYVMTPEYGAASQLEKIDMLDFAEFVAINKFDRKGAADALRDVAKQVQRNREAFKQAPDEMPVFGTMASRFNDDGVTALYQALQAAAGRARPDACSEGRLPAVATRHSTHQLPIVPAARVRYLAEIADTRARLQAPRARAGRAGARDPAAARQRSACCSTRTPRSTARARRSRRWREHAKRAWRPMRRSCWRCGPRCSSAYAGDEYVVKIRDKEIRTALVHHHAVGQQDPQGGAAGATKTTASC